MLHVTKEDSILLSEMVDINAHCSLLFYFFIFSLKSFIYPGSLQIGIKSFFTVNQQYNRDVI